ncbi:hypothetical protein ACHWQZ_G016228 [Mnemiopsis leidyi]
MQTILSGIIVLVFSGELCAQEATDCGCVHGTCSDDPHTTCNCDLGWKGFDCSVKITTCDDNPCQNGTGPNQMSVCKEYTYNRDQRNIHCQCGVGLTGKYCERTVDMCSRNPCRGNGNCTDLGGGEFRCDCFPGYTAVNCEDDIDECKEDPCQNGGECRNTIGDFYCECRPGYGGNFCEKNIDNCANDPCKNGGTCNDGENSYTCTCQPGFTGENCETEINECENNTCPSYSVCVDKINRYRCICNSADENRGNCEIDENECTANLCKNGGTCVDLPGDFRCECPEGYSGDTCQFDDTACGVKPCRHGTCKLLDIDNHYCVCDPGYAGPVCSIDIDDCQPNPCQNKATCIDQLSDFFCECPAVFTGKKCDLDAKHCANNPCHNGGSCAPASSHPFYKCTCERGYTGNRCQEEILCAPTKCGNKGKCIMLDESTDTYRCECDQDFEGPLCETELESCGLDFCHNGGTCNSLLNRCDCAPGWKGRYCQDRLACSDRPCRNGGSCIPEPYGFQCRCPDGYTGAHCEIPEAMVCSPNPCQNGGICSADGGTHTCKCPATYTGRNCETRDFCLDNPCKHGYVCENFPPKYKVPMKYICCEEKSWRCYNDDDNCPNECNALKNDSICQEECYNTECQLDAADCAQNLQTPHDAWSECPNRRCSGVFNDGECNSECNNPECNYDGMDCIRKTETCEYEKYCRTYFNNNLCDQGCNNTACMWDGRDCLQDNSHYKAKDGIKMTLDVTCERVTDFKSQLTLTLDEWSRAITVIDSAVPVINEENRCDLYLSFDNRYCGSDCRTANVTTLKSYLWACLQSNHSASPFPFRVMAMITSAESDKTTLQPEQVSTAIIATIAVIGLLLLIAAVMVGRNVYRARARLWEPDGFKTSRKRNIKDISKMGDPVHLKTIPKLSEQHNFNYYMSENMSQVMEVDLEPMYIMSGRTHGRGVFDDQDETAPMITQAAYELRQRDETASPVTQAEEQVAIGRPSGRIGLGRGETQLHVVCRNKKADELKRILAQGNVDVNVQDAFGRTPLYAAVGSDAGEIVDILLEVENIDLEKPIVQKGSTPLILASRMVYNSIVEKLLKARAQVNAVDSSGRTALHWAAAVCNMQAMELLLNHGANKDAESIKKETPLFLAAREGKLEAVKFLVYHNAQRNLADSMDQTPIDVARDHLHTDIEEVLLTWNTDGNTVLKQQHVQLPGSLTPPQSDDAATGSPNSIPTLSPCEKEASDRDEKKNSKRKKKKTEHNPQSHQTAYNQTSYWAKNQLHSPPNWMSTQMLSPESLTGSPTSTSLPTSCDPNVPSSDSHQRLTHYPLHAGYPIDTPQSYIPHDHLLSQHRPNNNRQYSHHPAHQLDYHSSPDSPEETWQITSPPNSDWSHTSP